MRAFSRLLVKLHLKIAILLSFVFMVGCACWSVQHADEPACRDLRQAIDCTEQNIASRVPAFAPLVGLVTGSGLDQAEKDQMLGTLAQAGVGALACAVKAVVLAAAPVAAVAPGQQAGPERLRAHLRATHSKSYGEHWLEANHVRFKKDPQPAAVDFSSETGQ